MRHDLLNTELLLPESARMMQSALRDFLTQQRIVETIRTCNVKEEPIPRWLVTELAQLELFGASIHGYGCLETDAYTYGIIMQELERADSALRSFASVHNALVMYPISQFGSDAQKEYWLPLLRTTNAIGCFGLTEEYGGSNPAAMKTRAKRDGADYVLNGSKLWITNGTLADVAVVWARTQKGIRGFLVPKETKGFSATKITGKWSLRASVSAALFLDDCRVPRDSLLPGTEIGIKAALSCLNEARYGIAWGAIGAAEACYETTLEFAKTRAPFGKPIAATQLIQKYLVDMALGIANAKLLALQLARLKDEEKLTHYHISAGKLHNVRVACEVASRARSVLGAAGITYDMPVGAHLLNLETVETYEGTEEIHILSLGKHLTGLNAF